MFVEDLHNYVELLEENQRLLHVKVEVNPVLELSEILRRVAAQHLGKAVLFDRVAGSKMRVLGNAFGSEDLVALSLGVRSLDELGGRLEGLLKPELPHGLLESIRALPRLRELAGFAPRVVKSGPVKEVVNTANPTLAGLPIPKVWPKDGGRFITFPLVVTRDPDTGVTNIGVYRMQVYDDRTLGVHWQLHRKSAQVFRDLEKRGEKMDVAVVIGADPATIFAGVAPVPDAFDEYLFAGFVRGGGLELVECETVDLKVPARAEIVLEGYVNPGEYRLEGPFGDHTGYYTPPEPYPVFHLTGVLTRSDPIYLTTVVGKPIQEDAYLAKAASSVFTAPLKILFPEIVDLYLPPEGVFTNLAIVSIKKRYPGHAKKVMMGLWAMPQLMFLKVIIVVDDDVNIRDWGEVVWATTTRFDPARDVLIVPSTPTDSLDHASPAPNLGSKMGIDATVKWREEGYTREWPEVVSVDEDTKKLVDARWAEYFD
ncbi:MAG: menaquinone biosynthesis decarboxylase [Thermoprotei archaeon]